MGGAMLALLALQLASVSARPSAFEVASVPFHRQVTEYACGKQFFAVAAPVEVAFAIGDSQQGCWQATRRSRWR
jgi:hypothetical protein